MDAERERDTPTDSESMVRWLYENGREILFVVDTDKRFKLVNPAWTRATGWSEAEVIGRPVRDLIHPDDHPEVDEHMARLADGGEPESSTRVLMKDGGWRWFSGRAQLLADGQIIGLVRDVSEERARRLELEEVRKTRALLSGAAGIGTWGYEPLEERVVWSDDIRAITGYTQAEITTPEQFAETLDPEEAEAVQAIFAAGVASGEGQTFEHRMRHKDGAWSTWRATYRCEARPGGVFALLGISQNITELAQARDGALKGERHIRQLIEAAPFAVALFDLDLRYQVASAAWRHTFSLNHRPYLGRRITDVFPGMPKRFLRAQTRALEGLPTISKEDRFTDSQGNEHWIRWEARPWRDTTGEVLGMLVQIDDISAVSKAKREAQTNARRLKVALSAADAGVYEIDHVNKTFWSSPEFKKLVGRASSSYRDAQKLRFPRFHPDDMDQVRQAFVDIRDRKVTAGEAFEARVITPKGEERWVRVFHHLKRDRRGRWLKGVGLIHDFDERKRQELALIEAQRAAEAGADAKAAFLANMSHEIRTPMNGVMGVLHLLKTEALTEEGRSMLEEALSCGQMLAELLNDVIDFSKIEAGHLELASEPVDPSALAHGVARLLRPQVEGRGLQLRLEGFETVGWVRTDPVRLRQALFNLVGNAVKFTLEGHIVIRAALRPGDPHPVLRLEIEDTGIGIPADAQDRIFQRFDQGDASTTRRFGGSGLGLAITRRLAEMMGGDVGFSSTEGVGSTFWLEVAAPPAERAQAVPETADAVLEGLRILVVEDNATNRMIATKLLENLGASVETAPDGLLGVEAATRGAFDLILMDVQMPGIDGLEAARRIRALGGAAAGVPIVALTANVLAHQRQSYLEAGMDGVVGKPISPAALLTEIARLSGAPDGEEEAVA
jgi:PAS domain S-box-containing protein